MSTNHTPTSLALAALLASLVWPAMAHETPPEERRREYFQPGAAFSGLPGDTDAPVPFHVGLGDRSFPISTASADAQRYFDQGLALAWGFNHAEAIRSFRAAQMLDPACAMCFWGEALALGPNINDGMAPAAVVPAWVAIQKAIDLSVTATDKEKALIDALSRRYGANPMASRAALDGDWAAAIGAVAARYPDDADILALHAEALMNLQPWDYWEADGTTAKGRAAEIVSTLEKAMAVAPDHPGALHLYIHAVEASADPGRAEAAADRLRDLAPSTGHLLHMPAHIYARVGRHADSIVANRQAITADDAFLDAAGEAASPLYRFGYVPHNVHYLLVSAQMAGLGEEVITAADRLREITSDEVSEDLAWVQAIRTAPYTGHAQFSDAETILELPNPGARFPFVQGFWHYARGLAEVRSGDPEGARVEAASIDALIDQSDLTTLEAQYLPARTILSIARDMILARAAAAEEDWETAERLVLEAIDREKEIGYMEPPYWYYPLHQTLGALHLMQGNPTAAVAAFETALEQAPRNGWALWGLARAQREAGVESGRAEADLEKVWLGDRSLLSLDRL